MSLTQSLLNEALTDEQRKDRNVRKHVLMVVQKAIEDAASKAHVEDDVWDQRSMTNAAGDIVCRVSMSIEDDNAERVFISWVHRILKQAGITNVTSTVKAKDADGTVHRRFRVVVDRGHLVAMGASNPMDDVMNGVLSEDVSKPITSSGSTRGLLPAHLKKIQADKDAAAAAIAAGAHPDTVKLKPGEKPDDEEELDDEGNPVKPEDKVFEALSPFAKAEQNQKLVVDDLKVQGSVRRVSRAKLLWKKKEGDGTFTERWMYLAQSISDLVEIKRKILAGTDIPVNKTTSPDGHQGFVMEQFGDCVFLTINGVVS